MSNSRIALKLADNSAQAPFVIERRSLINEIKETGHRLIQEEGVLSLKTLNISGEDIMNLGIKQGPAVGKIMNMLLDDVLEQKIPNENEALKTAAKTYLQFDDVVIE